MEILKVTAVVIGVYILYSFFDYLRFTIKRKLLDSKIEWAMFKCAKTPPIKDNDGLSLIAEKIEERATKLLEIATKAREFEREIKGSKLNPDEISYLQFKQKSFIFDRLHDIE